MSAREPRCGVLGHSRDARDRRQGPIDYERVTITLNVGYNFYECKGQWAVGGKVTERATLLY
jgi:hypothetical protein